MEQKTNMNCHSLARTDIPRRRQNISHFQCIFHFIGLVAGCATPKYADQSIFSPRSSAQAGVRQRSIFEAASYAAWRIPPRSCGKSTRISFIVMAAMA
jgi:hypothetical protein